jgi:nicotinamide riboside kinase
MNVKLRKRIVITGPESSGKSTLAAWLAEEFEVPMATEFARIYLETYGAGYDESTVIAMAQLHLIHQQEMVPVDAPLGIFDTDLLNFKIWCDVAYSHCDASILAGIEQESNHVYLVCYPDLPWVADPLREHPDERLLLFERHLTEIKKTGREYIIIRGEGENRKMAAREAMKQLKEKHPLIIRASEN